ncbi:sporulation integral membrane protein YtvI [Virgibacillus salexigens]|uniref:sporulation integral membrane protein YtvI n=1 Tax=Virgibacillus salexigens TaxID=61016 RepID=UPI001909F376|nr:sporulation integral membrane protein YtvI [Virgibacillus salexigens]
MYKPLFYQLLRLLIVVSFIFAIYIIITASFVYLYPLFIAILIAMLMNPTVTTLEVKLKFPRMLAVVTTMILFISCISGVFLFIFSELFQGTLFLAEKLPQHFQTFSGYITDFINNTIMPLYQKVLSYFQMLDTAQQHAISDNVQQFLNNLTTSATGFLQDLLFKLPGVITSLPGSITVFIFILLAVFLISNDYSNLRQLMISMIPSIVKSPGKKITRHLKKTVAGYLKAQLILVLINAFIVYVGLLLFQFEHAFTIALYTAFVDLLPYIGSGIIFVPWMFYLFLIGNYSMTINLSILYGIIIIVRQVIEPKVLSSSMGLHPLAALIILFIGIQLWGVSGFILAPVFLIVINALHRAGTFQDVWRFIKG